MPSFIKKLMEEEELSINITSMIDVIFILLIFFMVSTQFKKNSLPLELPQSEDKTVQENDTKLKVLSVTQDKIYFEGAELSMNEVQEALEEALRLNPEIAVSLECEKTVDFQRVVQVLTKIQNAGISKIGIVHEQSE